MKKGFVILLVIFINMFLVSCSFNLNGGNDTEQEEPEQINEPEKEPEQEVVLKDYDLSNIVFKDTTYIYDGENKSILIEGSLPDGLTVTYVGNGQTEVGTYEIEAIFTNSNSEYKNPSSIKAVLTIVEEEKVELSMESQSFVYDGEVHQLEITGLPEGYEVSYNLNDIINVGVYEIEANVVHNDKSWTLNATLTITKSTYDMSGISFENKTVTYDEKIHYLEISGTLPDGVDVEYLNNGQAEVGSYEVVAKFYGDPNNYNEISDLKATLTINEANTPSEELGSDVYYIIASGDYTISGNYSQIRVNVSEEDTEKVRIYLDGVTVSNDSEAPIYIMSADKVILNCNEGKENFVYDNRLLTSGEEDVADAAIYSECDLNLAGKGSLHVESTYNNGVHSKDDLQIKNLTLYVKAPNNAIKGNDSVTIESGDLTIISTGGDGIKTSNSDISSKGNQRGTITITGGTIKIYSACDAIDAAYDVVIEETKTAINIEAYTAKNSSYSSDLYESGDASNSKTYYLKLSSTYSSYRYALYLYNDDGSYEWVNSTYVSGSQGGIGPGGGGRRSYYYKFETKTSYQNFKLYAFNQNQSANSTTNYVAVTSGGVLNQANNCIEVKSINSNSITISWTYYTEQQSFGPGGFSGGQGGNSNKLDYSAKGIKADNQISINGGTILIKSTDDGIHANCDNQLENGESPLGNITITNGNLNITSGDDAIHADNKLVISDGVIVASGYEGIEANNINLNGGTITVVGQDDGINAGYCGTKNTPQINITGGLIDVAVSPSGDTDGLDSNGTITMTGGVVITRGPNSQMATALDADGQIKVTGGVLVVIGYCPTISTTLTKTQSTSGLTSGSHTITIGSQIINYNNSYSYSGKVTIFATSSATVK